MNFIGTGQRLSGDDIVHAAKLVGCEVAALQAVISVEARGQGFDAKKRPIILFEPHVFYRNLRGEERQRAVNQGLAWSSWKPGQYPASQDGRYDQVDRGMKINESSALMAPSWGIGQVLGENHEMCGFKTPQDLMLKCLEGEGGQLEVMVGFILGKGLGDELRRKDWDGFSEGYNGKAYRKNDYHIKLRRDYLKFSAGQPAQYDPLADGLLSIGDKGGIVKALQLAIGVHADGDFGPMSDQAVRAFQREHGLIVDGKVGKQTGQMLGLTFWN